MCVCVKHNNVYGRGKQYTVFLHSSFAAPCHPPELKARKGAMESLSSCFAFLTLHSWCLLIWPPFIVERQIQTLRCVGTEWLLERAAVLLILGQSKFPYRCSLVTFKRKMVFFCFFVFFYWALCYLSEVQGNSFQQVSVLKWKGHFSNPFQSLLLCRFAKISQCSPPDLIWFDFFKVEGSPLTSSLRVHQSCCFAG